MASSTSSQGSSNSEPVDRAELGPAVVADGHLDLLAPEGPDADRSPSPRNSVVVTEKTRSPPSSWAAEVRRMSGQVGHGLSPARSAGGSGMISSWWTLRAPWRWTVPRQSAPVSPPPMMTTCLPSAEIGRLGQQRPPAPGWTASGSPWPGGCPRARGPGPGRSRGRVAPPASTTASNSSTRSRRRRPRWHPGPAAAGTSGAHAPTDTPHRNSTPSATHLVEPAVEHRLLHLELGDPVAEQAAGLLGPLEHHHLVAGPGQLLGGGQPGRAGADHRHPLAGRTAPARPGPPSPRPRPARRSRTRSARWSPGRR